MNSEPVEPPPTRRPLEPLVMPSLSGAFFSDCRAYRYTLWRRWSHRPLFSELPKSLVAFVGLNPSTADEFADDPTIRRCKGFAKEWGFDGLVMLNIFAFRATDPRDMKSATWPVGPSNDEAIQIVQANCGAVVCCWGANGDYLHRSEKVRDDLRAVCPEKLFHFGLTAGCQPKHPLYLPASTQRILWA